MFSGVTLGPRVPGFQNPLSCFFLIASAHYLWSIHAINTELVNSDLLSLEEIQSEGLANPW